MKLGRIIVGVALVALGGWFIFPTHQSWGRAEGIELLGFGPYVTLVWGAIAAGLVALGVIVLRPWTAQP